MKRFVSWFNRTAPGSKEPLPVITRAGTAHLFFELIHPFEDGNGRIGRAIAEKAIAQSFGQQVLVFSATTILAHQKNYYEALERANRLNDITEWLVWFAAIALEAQRRSVAQVELIIAKTKLLDRLRGQISERQQKALLRMFREGPRDSRAVSAQATTARSREHHRPQRLAIWPTSQKRVHSSAQANGSARYALNLPMLLN